MLKAGALLFLVLAIASAVGGVIATRNTIDFLDEAQRTTGIVTGYDAQRDSDSVAYYPKIRFSSGSGEEIEFVSDSGSNSKSYEVGEPIEVLYRPQDPKDARRSRFLDVWFLTVAAAIAAPTCGLAAFIFFRMARSGATVRAGPPSLGADPGTLAQWNVGLTSGHEKLYQGMAYAVAATGVILLTVTAVVVATSDDLDPLIAIPGLLAVGSLLAAKKTVTDVRRNTTTRAKRALRETGQPVPANVIAVTEVDTLSVGEAQPHRLIAEDVDPKSGQTRRFESDYIWHAVSPDVVDQPVTVWLRPDRTDRYWVDLETLGKT